jgi:hypothetical protein
MVAEAKTRYRIWALDPSKLHEALLASHVPFEEAEGGALLRLANENEAAQALAWVVRRGIAVHRFGPAGSALEQTYMAMEEDRR